MTASRNTLLAIGLMLLALAAGKTAAGQSYSILGGDSPASDAPGGPGGAPAPDNSIAPAGPAANGNGNACGAAVCDSGGAVLKDTDCRPNARWLALYARMQQCVEETPVLAACAGEMKDVCELCQSCTWKADASAIIMHRSAPGPNELLIDPTTGGSLFSASGMKSAFAGGPRVSLTALDCEGWGFEVNFFEIDGWSSTTDLTTAMLPNGANLIVDSVKQIPLNNANPVAFDSTSHLYSTELNFRRPLFGGFSFLAGVRWVDLTDTYLASGTSAVTGNMVSHSILTHNHLCGFQIGTDGTIYEPKDKHWRLTGFVKGGIYLNCADETTYLSDAGAGGLGVFNPSSDYHCDASFFGETGLIGYVHVCNHVSVSAGYQVMFVNGVAQPTNQIANNTLGALPIAVDTSSGIFYHGASVGMEVTW